MSGITLQTEGRRTYITGNTYPIRDQIRAIGAHWDAKRKAWWTSKRAEAEALIAQAGESAPAAPQPSQQDRTPRDGKDSIVAGRAEYKGRTYYIAGRRDSAGGRRVGYGWADAVEAVTTRDGAKVLLYFRDGSSQFWADRSAVSIVKTYDRAQTIAKLAEYAQRAKDNGGPLEPGYYYASNGEVLASGCSACRQLGRMCRACEHDYE